MKARKIYLLGLLVVAMLFTACDNGGGSEDTTPRPTVDFTFSPANPIAGQSISFSGTASNATSYQWSSNPVSFTATSLNANYTFTEPGTYQVTLRATGEGGTAQASKTVTVAAPAPTADFTFSPESPRVGESVSFTSQVNNVTSYQWSSNPAGFSSTEANPSHSFSQAGAYTITLEASGPGGNVTVNKQLTVIAEAPVAGFSYSPQNPLQGESISFSNTSSNAESYQWSSDAGGFNSTDENPSFAFAEAGTYAITLVATGPGGSDQITQNITVAAPAAVADFSFSPANPVAGQTVSFSNLSSNAASYQWTSDTGGFSSSEENPSFVFAEAGAYAITLIATGPGGSDQITQTITVAAPAPVADFSFSPANPVAGQTVSFTNLSSNATSYQWSSSPAGFSSTEENPQFNFSEAGSYAITLLATGPGGTDEITQNISIAAPPPVADFVFSPVDPEIDQVVTFSNLSTNAESYQWSSDPAAFSSTEENPSFAFTEPGRYTITLVANGPGGESSLSKELNVTAPVINKLIQVSASRQLEKNRPTGPSELLFRNGSAQFYSQREDNNSILYLFPEEVTLMGENYTRLQSNLYFFDNLNINGTLRFTNSEIINQVPAFNQDFGVEVPEIPEPATIPSTNELLNGIDLDFSAALGSRRPDLFISVRSNASSESQSATYTPNANGIIENFKVQGLDASQGFRIIITDRQNYEINEQDWIIRGTVEGKITFFTTAPTPAPVASFTFSPANPKAGEDVTFTNTSTNADSYLWTFSLSGSGGARIENNTFTSTDTNPVVTFPDQGNWSVVLQATGPGGTVNSEATFIDVAPAEVGGGGDDNPCNLPSCYVSQTVTNSSAGAVTTNYSYTTVAGRKVLSQLQVITGAGGFGVTTTTNYEHNAQGQRIRSTTSRTVLGTTTITVIVEYEYDGLGRLIRENTLNESNALISYITYSHLGSTRNIDRINSYNEAGVLQDYSIYDQYTGSDYGRVRNFEADGTLETTSTYTWENCQPKTIITVAASTSVTVLNQVNQFGSNRLISSSTSTVRDLNGGNEQTATTTYSYNCD